MSGPKCGECGREIDPRLESLEGGACCCCLGAAGLAPECNCDGCVEDRADQPEPEDWREEVEYEEGAP